MVRPSLSIDLAGIELKNPFIVAAAPYTTSTGQISKYAQKISKAGWAGIVAKTFAEPGGPKYRNYPGLWTRRDIRKGNAFYVMKNSGYCIMPSLSKEEFEAEVKVMHSKDLKVIGSIASNYVKLAKDLEECGVDMIELSISCPVLTVWTSGGGLAVRWQNPTGLIDMLKEVKKQCTVPIMPKISAHVSNPEGFAVECEQVGVDAISAIDTVGGILGIDENTGSFVASDVHGKNYMGGLSGPYIRPIALYTAARIALSGTKIDICGIGGVNDWRSAVEFMMVGARAIQCGTAVMMQGFDIVEGIVSNLTTFMTRRGYTKIDDFIGLALKKIQKERVADFNWRGVAKVDNMKCNGCSLCVQACLNAGAHPGSISLERGKAVVNEDTCAGCGLCGIVCPKEAIAFGKVPYTPCEGR